MKHLLQYFAMLSFLLNLPMVNAELTGASALSVGGEHSCVLTTAGGMRCWGSNSYGELGTGSLTPKLAAVNVEGLTTGVISIATGGSHTCAVGTTGAVKCFGRNQSGQLGDGSTTQQNVPVDVVGLTAGFVRVAAASNHTCVLSTGGGVKCWGGNTGGQLGDGSTTQRNTPVDTSGLLSGVSAIFAGGLNTCVLTTAGGVRCWGSNTYGQVGDGTTTQRNTPVNVTGLSVGVQEVEVGNGHACALTTAGGIKCWGGNNYGQLGDGSTTQRNTPVDVVGLASGASSITAGYTTCVVTSAGGAKCWGYNNYGSIGDGTTIASSSPIDVPGLSVGISYIAAETGHTCAMTDVGTVMCWGDVAGGRLGDGVTDLRYGAIDVTGLTAGVHYLSAGGSHNCVITTLGGAKCWGANSSGELGDGTTTDSVAPVDVLGLTSGVSAIAAGDGFTCAVTVVGGTMCWGVNSSGQLGDGTVINRLTPVSVVGLTVGVSDIAVYYAHACALTTSGGVKCWGRNNWGELGDGTTVTRSTPADVQGLTSGASGITVGSRSSCALTTFGGIKCWGANTWGQLGDGTTIHRYTPGDVIGLTDGVSGIDSGQYHVCALLSIGGARCWGSYSDGQLGGGSVNNGSLPVSVVGLESSVASISAGHTHTCASYATGGVACWGNNGYAAVGDGTTINRNSPVNVEGIDGGISSVSVGGHSGGLHSCALTTAMGVKCWGRNYYGVLGVAPYKHPVLNAFDAQGVVTEAGNTVAGVVFRLSGMGPEYYFRDYTTDGTGNYTLPIVEGIPYTITPRLAGYTFSPPSLTGTMAGDFTQDFVATLITYNITGNVAANGAPLAGASVDGGALGVQLTDSSGNYAFNAILPATAYTLTVSHAGATFGTATATGTLNGHATHDFTGTLNTYSITGTVTVSGAPLVGVSVDGGALGATTSDTNGEYTFAGITYGTAYAIAPTLSNYLFAPTAASGTVTGATILDFAGSYVPPSTTPSTPSTSSPSTSSPSTSSPSTSSGFTTSTIISATTVPSTVPTTTTQDTTTTSIEITITAPSTSITTSTTIDAQTTSVAVTTTTVATSSTVPSGDTDNDGVTDDEEIQTGTNPKDPGSKAPRLRTVLCSDWNGYLSGASGRGMYNIMEHVNLTTKKLRVKTELRSIRGHLKDTYEFFLRGNQQFDLLVHDFSGREVNSYGQICTSYQRALAGSVDGRMVYYKFGEDNHIDFAFALPFENPQRGDSVLQYNAEQPSLRPGDADNQVANWVQLSNVSKARLKGKLYFHGMSGAVLGEPVSVNLRDGARYDYAAHIYGADGSGIAGSGSDSHGTPAAGFVRFVPDNKAVEYQLREVRYLYDNAGVADSFVTAYPFGRAVGSGERMLAPIAATSGTVVLELANVLGKKVSASVKLYNESGRKLLLDKTIALPAYSSSHLLLHELLGGSQNSGLLIVKGSHTGSIVGHVVHYALEPSGGVRNMHALALQEPVGTVLRGSYNSYLNQGCVLSLGNISTLQEKVSILIQEGDVTKPAISFEAKIPGHGNSTIDICSKVSKNTYGTVQVTAGKPKRIAGQLIRLGAEERYRMATALR